MGGPHGSRFIAMGGGRSALTPASANSLSLSHTPGILNTLGKGSAQPLPVPPCFWHFAAITWPHPNPASTKAVLAEVDGLHWTTLHTSCLAELVMEVLIIRFAWVKWTTMFQLWLRKPSWWAPLHSLQCGMSRKEVLLPMEEFLCHPCLPGVISL